MPSAQGLFRRAIAESVAGHHVTGAAPAQWIGQHFAELLLNKVGATREEIAAADPKRLLEAQQQVDVEALAQATGLIQPDPEHWGEVAFNALPFEPVIDGEILTARPIDRIRDGAGAGVDVMVGMNAEDFRLFMVLPFP